MRVSDTEQYANAGAANVREAMNAPLSVVERYALDLRDAREEIERLRRFMAAVTGSAEPVEWMPESEAKEMRRVQGELCEEIARLRASDPSDLIADEYTSVDISQNVDGWMAIYDHKDLDELITVRAPTLAEALDKLRAAEGGDE